ncbi:hypothetical protein EDD86DRAFT_214497 [Gorgonomyces haynaldii]|nr:hypothetical protein EDD86DRAFT_214497 [Gorgonomyces haynaldii]
MWQFPSCCQFLYLFFHHFSPDLFDTDLFEQYFLENLDWTEDLNVKMFRLATRNRFIVPRMWLGYLEKEYLKQGLEMKFTKDMQYSDLDPKTRVEILYFLCQLQLDRPELFKPVLETPEQIARHWRVDPIGSDRHLNNYWLFDDNRLYVERDGKWELKCRTILEWKQFPENFNATDDPREQLLYTYLVDQAGPLVIKQLMKMEKSREERGFQFQPIPLEPRKSGYVVESPETQEIVESREVKPQEFEYEQWMFEEPRYETRRSRTLPKKRKVDYSSMSLAEQRAHRIQERQNRVYQKSESESESETEYHDPWVFKCPCGLEGDNVDDGKPSIECGICHCWMHIKCVGPPDVPFSQWSKGFICQSCAPSQE